MSFHFLLVLLLLTALAFVLVPYIRSGGKRPERVGSDSETNVEIYAARLKELERELEAGHILQAEFDQLKDETGLSLLTDSRDISSVHNAAKPLKRRTHLILAASSALVVVIFPWVMYTNIGAWPEVEIQEAAKVLERQDVPTEDLQSLVQLLNDRLLEAPLDSNSWYLLGHAHMKQGSFTQSVNAFERLRSLVGFNVNTDISLAQARYMANDGNISDANRQAMQDILKRAPHQPVVLEILAIEAFQNKDAAAAISYLEQGLAGGLRGGRAESFRAGIKRAQEMSGEPVAIERVPAVADRARMVIQISIDPAVKASPETAIFVFAREQGGMPMPLAVKRLRVADLPTEIVFSDADAMVKSRLISQFDSIELVARLSFSGQPSLQPGDIENRVSNVVVAQLDAPIVLRLEP